MHFNDFNTFNMTTQNNCKSYNKNRIQIVFRHGARAPSQNALQHFLQYNVAKQWKENELEQLTSIGLDQCRALGEYLGKRLFEKSSCGFKLRWHSSKVERTKLSGKEFIKGLVESGMTRLTESQLSDIKPYPIGKQDDDPDLYFRTYKVDKNYLEKSHELRNGPVFITKSQREATELALLKPDLKLSMAQLLDTTTHFEELFECERFWPNDGERSALTDINSIESHLLATRLAHWCWNERFFKLHDAKTLGLPLLKEIEKVARSTEEPLVIYSVHDYTIMMLLSLIGLDSYPCVTLGFCSYIIFYGDSIEANISPFRTRELIISHEYEIYKDEIFSLLNHC